MGEKPTEQDEARAREGSSGAGVAAEGPSPAGRADAAGVDANGPAGRHEEGGKNDGPGTPVEATNLNLSRSNIERTAAPNQGGGATTEQPHIPNMDASGKDSVVEYKDGDDMTR